MKRVRHVGVRSAHPQPTSSTSSAASYDTNGNFIEFVEPGNNPVTAASFSHLLRLSGTISTKTTIAS
jgi:hypothetical protein